MGRLEKRHRRQLIVKTMDRPQIIFLFVALLSPALVDAAYLDDWARMKGITPRHYICTRAAQPVTIDGKLDDPAWQSSPWTERR